MTHLTQLPRLLSAIAIAACALIASAPAHAVQDCEINGESVNPNNGNTTRGKTGLMRCKDRDTGVIQREQELRDGKDIGIVRFYKDGKLAKEHSVNEKGNMEGRAREFAANGQVVFDATYVNSNRVGIARGFHENGQPRRVTFYSDKSDEQAYAEFTDRGELSSLRCGDKPLLAPHVDDAKLCGFSGQPSQVELFSGKGQIRSRLRYLDGKRVRLEQLNDAGKPTLIDEVVGSTRTERRFDTDGALRREIRLQAAERGFTRESEKEFSEKGTLVREQRFAQGQLASDARFYLNGQPRSRIDYTRDGVSVRTVNTDYYDTGKLASEGAYVSVRGRGEQPVGSHKRFDDQGRLAAESIYDDKGKLSRERVWDEAGKIVRDDEVFEDGSRKAFSR
ncbi:toxin-antitoxin system YwqK family antitoxin [Variovorax sp. VNK109]|uniref:toxin-antitoxin system YwqK family antitoxin n=1 Tax=Variovorax sp. VNK109 TaxID=3400919 RepID=UPI003C01F3C9